MISVAPGVEDLQQDFATGIVHAGSDEPVPAGLLMTMPVVRRTAGRPCGMRVAAPGDDQPDTAAGAFGEILGQSCGVTGTVLQAGVHRAHDDPVPQLVKPRSSGESRFGYGLLTGASHLAGVGRGRHPQPCRRGITAVVIRINHALNAIPCDEPGGRPKASDVKPAPASARVRASPGRFNGARHVTDSNSPCGCSAC